MTVDTKGTTPADLAARFKARADWMDELRGPQPYITLAQFREAAELLARLDLSTTKEDTEPLVDRLAVGYASSIAMVTDKRDDRRNLTKEWLRRLLTYGSAAEWADLLKVVEADTI